MDVLFILKKRSIYSEYSYSYVNSGLFTSARLVDEMLRRAGVKSKMVEVNDNNEIDKYVTQYKPKKVIIEALYVVPEKFEILQKLHPNVQWIIRLHSEIPFLANEGVAMKWLKQYVLFDNVVIAANSQSLINSLEHELGEKIYYMPNYYPETYKRTKAFQWNSIVNIGMFGASRPFKNFLAQALAAKMYAEENHKVLHLHINTGRIEQNGENSLKNVRALFEGTYHKLIEYDWLNHDAFLKVVSNMDLGLQVSLSETYNIVAADFVMQGVPIVTSKEINFVNPISQVDNPKDASQIFERMQLTMIFKRILTPINKLLLQYDSYKSRKKWLTYFK